MSEEPRRAIDLKPIIDYYFILFLYPELFFNSEVWGYES